MTASSQGESTSTRSRPIATQFAPWRLSWVALVLFVLFGTIVIGAALPAKLVDPAWQLGLFSAVVNTAGFPLVGMGLLHLAADLDPTNEQLHNQRRLCARLAVPVALGFVLMVPLQAYLLWQHSSTVLGGRESQLNRAERAITSLREAVQGATSTDDLQKRLQALNRPRLSPAEIATPLPMIKLQAKTALEQAESALRQQRQSLPRGGVFSLVQLSLRNSVGCLALALGFAALGQRRHSKVPLLQEWLVGFQTMRTKAYWRRLTKPKKKDRRPYR